MVEDGRFFYAHGSTGLMWQKLGMLLRAGYRFSAADNKARYIQLGEKNSEIHVEEKMPAEPSQS